MNETAVILPVYIKDKLDFFKEAIESLLSQTHKSFSIVVVKDGPIDGEVEDYLQTILSDNIQILDLKENKGLPVALNKGIKHCLTKGYKYIARMDADDISHPKRLETQIDFLRKNPKTLIVGTNATIIDEAGNTLKEKVVKSKVSLNNLLLRCELIHPSVMFRAEFFDKIGYYNESLRKSQDYELWMRTIVKGGEIRNINEALIRFRYEPDIVRRRKAEQRINIQLKKKFAKWPLNLLYSVPNYLILISPKSLLNKMVLKKKVST